VRSTLYLRPALMSSLLAVVILALVVGFIEHPVRSVAVRHLQTGVGRISDPGVVQQLLKRFNVPGVSIAIIKDFKIAWTGAYGIADRETQTPVTADTLFQAASISKPVAAMVSLKAVQDGRFSLDQNVNSILKSWKLPEGEFTKDQPVTPRALLSHTSGAGDAFGFPGYPPGSPLPTVQQILDGVAPSNLRAVRLERPPFTAAK
jgi:CubicO group peptidase (beta-lactamase class C family)